MGQRLKSMKTRSVTVGVGMGVVGGMAERVVVVAVVVALMGFFEIGIFKAIAIYGSLAGSQDSAYCSSRSDGSFTGWLYSLVTGLVLGVMFEAWGETVNRVKSLEKRQKEMAERQEQMLALLRDKNSGEGGCQGISCQKCEGDC